MKKTTTVTRYNGSLIENQHLPQGTSKKNASTIDYAEMNRVCLDSGTDALSQEEAHNAFMKSYPRMFRKQELLPLCASKESASRERIDQLAKAKQIEIPEVKVSHNIADHINHLRHGPFGPTSSVVKEARVKSLRNVSKKQSFERNKKDNQYLFKLLRTFSCFESIPDTQLKALCPHAYVERWTKDEIGYTVFSSSAAFIILSGSVTVIRQSSIKEKKEGSGNSKTEKLYPGDWFGFLKESSNNQTARYHTEEHKIITDEPCEFLKIHADAYERVVKTLESKEVEEKLDTLQQCQLFSSWPMLSLRTVCNHLVFDVKQAGEVLGEENYPSDVLFIIKEGNCVVNKKINDKHGRSKRVDVRELGPGDVVGHESVIGNVNLSATIVCRTAVKVACLQRSSLQDFDEVTLKLCQHRYEEMQEKMTTESVEEQYIDNQLLADWENYKSHVIADVIYYRGILPGHSKWARNPTQTP